jgi:TPR repeat protein
MKSKLTFLLSLTFLFLFSASSVVFGDYLQGIERAFERQDYKTAYKLTLPLAEQGDYNAQFALGLMYRKGVGVRKNFVLAHMWFNLASSRHKDGVKNKNLIEKKMSPEQIVQAQEMARNWKPQQKSKGLLGQFKEKFGIK